MASYATTVTLASAPVGNVLVPDRSTTVVQVSLDALTQVAIAAQIAGQGTTFDSTTFRSRKADLPGTSWRTIDGALVVPPEWVTLALSDAAPTTYVQRQLRAVLDARRALGYGSQFYFRNDVQWEIAQGTETDIVSGKPSFRLFDKVSYHGEGTTMHWNGTTAIAFGNGLRLGNEITQTFNGSGVLQDADLRFSTCLVVIDQDVAAGATSVHIASGTRADGKTIKVGDRVYWPQGGRVYDAKEPLWTDHATVVGITPDTGGGERTTAGYTYGGACTVRLDRGAGVPIVRAQCWVYRQTVNNQLGLFAQAPPPSSVGTLNGVSDNSGDNADNINAHCLFVNDDPVDYSMVEGFRIVSDAAVTTQGVRMHYVGQGEIRDIVGHGIGTTVQCNYNRGVINIANLSNEGYTGTSKSSGRVINVAGRGLVVATGVTWENGAQTALMCESGATLRIKGFRVKNWLPTRTQSNNQIVGCHTGGTVHITDFEYEGLNTVLVGRGGETETQGRVIIDGNVDIRTPDVNSQLKSMSLRDFAPSARLHIVDWDFTGTTMRDQYFAEARMGQEVEFPITPTISADPHPLPDGLIRSGRIKVSDLTGISNIYMQNGITPDPTLMPSKRTDVTIANLSTHYVSPQTAGSGGYNPQSDPGTKIIQIPNGDEGGRTLVTTVDTVNGLDITDGVFTNGSTAVTSASGLFTSAMTGRIVTADANASNIPSGATFTYVDTHNGTLSAAATANGTGFFIQDGSVELADPYLGPSLTGTGIAYGGNGIIAGVEYELPPNVCWMGVSTGRLNKARTDLTATNRIKITTSGAPAGGWVKLSIDTYPLQVDAPGLAIPAATYPEATPASTREMLHATDIRPASKFNGATFPAPLGTDLLTGLKAFGVAASDATVVATVIEPRVAVATMRRGFLNATAVTPAAGGLYVWSCSPQSALLISQATVYTVTAFAGSTLAKMQFGLWNDSTKVFTPLAESATNHTALNAAGANSPVTFVFASTGRITGQVNSLTPAVGTRYGFAFLSVGHTAGTLKGNGGLTSSIAGAIPGPVLATTLGSQTDTPTGATTLGSSATWAYAYGS